MLKSVLLKVFELAGSETDHIPPVMVSSIFHLHLLNLQCVKLNECNKLSLSFSTISTSIMQRKQMIEMRYIPGCLTSLHSSISGPNN